MKKLSIQIVILSFVSVVSALSLANTECFGEGEYRVCTETETFPDGTINVKSYDSMGNNYSVESGCKGNTCYSQDSEGNSYSIKSWCDDKGCHSEDSEGNRCTVTHSGKMIGCG
ncbi:MULTISPECIES: hypothetical protein [Haemophilus]|uniref:Uncharacterized protein n=1 Tax=Haemophilus aegyptius TaxID=197575 RepID=A0ABY1VV44_HAEAE|nr:MULTISPECIES: hypothetical protein [Haemophilus]OBX82068.1 hypothetical protein A9520_03265 [Haemophilus aegyptius]TMQ44261.1 hypothetical protein AO054_03720 [Haemophilus influenzae biotype aegyptius]UAK83298.1 hypothetical protein K8O83_03925 [Haemophilus aegyptius]SQH36784.1 Uncharacterised protein [Haemophilus aegyptius]VEH52728.1 Uncharacterised protein [Haemophilus aegyptius]